MTTVIQFPDLTEIDYAKDMTQESIKQIKTEFIFHLAAPYYEGINKTKFGFKAVSCMNNWWPSHAGENRKLTLWWMRSPGFLEGPQIADRKVWPSYCLADRKYGKIVKWLSHTGCGLKIGEPPFTVKLFDTQFNRFFTLLRMPLIVSPLKQRFLASRNYRHLDTGKLASYWINGWEPEKYDVEEEYKYFKTTRAEWAEHGEDEYR